MTATVPWNKNYFAPREVAGQQIVRGRAEGRFDPHPFEPGQTVDVIKAAAADDTHAMTAHGGYGRKNAGPPQGFFEDLKGFKPRPKLSLLVPTVCPFASVSVPGQNATEDSTRSEERRVGKECRSRWS